MRLVLILFSLALWSCAWGASILTVSIKEAPILSDNVGPRWLDNHHVIFRSFASDKNVFPHPLYVWDVDRGTATQDPRFSGDSGYAWVDPDTGAITFRGMRYERYENREGIPVPPVPPGTVFNPISGHPSKVNPPPWVVPGGGPNGHTSTSKVALKEEHGYLDRGVDGEDTRKNFPIFYHRTGIAEPIPLGLGSQQVEPNVTYLPFAGAYLLEGARSNLELAYPLWLLFPDGKLQQIFDPTGITWAQHSSALEVVTKRGVVFLKWTVSREQVGESGLYFWENEKLTRVLAAALQRPAVSPDGCRLAVINNRLGYNLRAEERYRIQVIDVCQGGHDVH